MRISQENKLFLLLNANFSIIFLHILIKQYTFVPDISNITYQNSFIHYLLLFNNGKQSRNKWLKHHILQGSN